MLAAIRGIGNGGTKAQEVKLAEHLITTLPQSFKPKLYHDESQEKLRTLIEAGWANKIR